MKREIENKNLHLSLEEIRGLLVAYKERNDLEAYNLLAISNIGLVNLTAVQYLGNGLTMEELISAGNLGLIDGINSFDYLNKRMEYFYPYILMCIVKQIRKDLNIYDENSRNISFDQLLPIYDENDRRMKLEDVIDNGEEIGRENHISMRIR